MKFKLAKAGPATIVAAAITLVCLFAIAEHYFGAHGVLQRLEWITFDWRARQALTKVSPAANNLGFGTYTGSAIAPTTTLSVTCTNGTTYNVGLNAGTSAGATVSARAMTGPGAEWKPMSEIGCFRFTPIPDVS